MVKMSQMIDTRQKEYIIRLFDIASIAKKSLIIFLLLLPFQKLLKIFTAKVSPVISKIISYSDEVSTLLMFGILFSFIALKPKVYTFRIIQNPLTRPLLLFIVVACISMVWNRVYIYQGIFGIYDVIKNILVFYVFSTLKWSRKEMLSFIFWIKLVVIIFAITGIIGSILAVAGVEQAGYIVRMGGEYKKRFGLDRVMLTGKGGINYLGMYALLGLFLIYATTKGKIKKSLGILTTLCLIFLTFSRQTWMGLFVMMVLTKRKLLWPGILIIGGILLLTPLSLPRYNPDFYYRAFTYIEAFNIFMNHPVIGAGPGMFGGLASVVFHSPYYYDWPALHRDMIYGIGSIDAFWPFISAESGTLGLLAYSLIWITLYKKIAMMSRWFKSNDNLILYNIGKVLKNYIVALFIMCFFTGINKPFVIYTFFALCGIYLSLFYRYTDQDKLRDSHNK